eukprot:7496669-Pyramimonas_sp.AAC.1
MVMMWPMLMTSSGRAGAVSEAPCVVYAAGVSRLGVAPNHIPVVFTEVRMGRLGGDGFGAAKAQSAEILCS